MGNAPQYASGNKAVNQRMHSHGGYYQHLFLVLKDVDKLGSSVDIGPKQLCHLGLVNSDAVDPSHSPHLFSEVCRTHDTPFCIHYQTVSSALPTSESIRRRA